MRLVETEGKKMKKGRVMSLLILVGVLLAIGHLDFIDQNRGTNLSADEMKLLVGGESCNDSCVSAGTGCQENSTKCTQINGECVICLGQEMSVCSSGGGEGCSQSQIPCMGVLGLCTENKGSELNCDGSGGATICGSSPTCQ
jgi:hypothetical protein